MRVGFSWVSGQGLVGYMKSMMGAWIKIGQTSDIKGHSNALVDERFAQLRTSLPVPCCHMTDVAGMTEKASGHFRSF